MPEVALHRAFDYPPRCFRYRWLNARGETGKPVHSFEDSGAAPATVGETRNRSQPLCQQAWEGAVSGGCNASARKPGDRPVAFHGSAAGADRGAAACPCPPFAFSVCPYRLLSCGGHDGDLNLDWQASFQASNLCVAWQFSPVWRPVGCRTAGAPTANRYRDAYRADG